MKTHLPVIVIALLLLHTAVNGQLTGRNKVDSLLGQLKITTEEITKVKTLNLVSSELNKLGKTDTALIIVTTALELARKTGFRWGEADAWFLTGQIYQAKLKPSEAVSGYEKAAALYQQLGLFADESECYYGIGSIYRRTNYDKALENFQKGLKTAQRTSRKDLQGKNAYLISVVLMAKGEYTDAGYYLDLTVKFYTEAGNERGVANGYMARARLYNHQGKQKESVENNYAALKLYEKTGDQVGMYNVYTGLGLMYEDQKNYKEALSSYLLAKKVAEELSNKTVLWGAFTNVGNMYRELGRTGEAFQAFNESLKLAESMGDKKGIATANGNLGTLQALMGKPVEALKSFHLALKLMEEVGAKESVVMSHLEIAKVHLSQNQPVASRPSLENALRLGKQYGFKNLVSQTYQLMSVADTASGDYVSAYNNYQQYIIYRDSVTNAEAAQQLLTQRMQYSFSKKEDSLRLEQALLAEKLEKQTLLSTQQQQELKLKQASLNLAQKEKDLQMLGFLKAEAELQLTNEQNHRKLTVAEREKAIQESELNRQTLIASQRQQDLLLKDKKLAEKRSLQRLSLAGIAGLIVLTFFIFRNYRNQRKANYVIGAEKKKTDDLLLNILPAEVAEEIKQNGAARAKLHQNVTVLFTDFVDFTRLSEHLTAEQIVAEIDRCFKAFDNIVEKYQMEKIKTIGDAYMAVSGLPVANEGHALNAVNAALEMVKYINANGMLINGEAIRMRVGINSGAVVAGIVGIKKFAYDIWGDTVNTAARMEKASLPGKINISQSTYQLVKDHFGCEYRGKINAKNKGEIDMYFVKEGPLVEPSDRLYDFAQS